MNESVRLLLALLLAVLIGSCGPIEAGEPPLKGATIGGPFTLTDHNGRTVSDAQFAGRYRLVYFGYSYCPDICPVDLQLIGQGLRQFERTDKARAARVQPIFITTDPERDTPAVLKQYVAAFHPRLIGLTGTPEQIDAVKKSFGVYSEKQQQAGASGYLVNHSRVAMLFGPKGEPIAIVPHDQDAEAVAAELDRWVA
jgi:protein SCO1/2